MLQFDSIQEDDGIPVQLELQPLHQAIERENNETMARVQGDAKILQGKTMDIFADQVRLSRCI